MIKYNKKYIKFNEIVEDFNTLLIQFATNIDFSE